MLFRDFIDRVKRMGFVGPYYSGIRGKMRFVLESTIMRNEIIFIADPEAFSRVQEPTGPELNLQTFHAFEQLARHKKQLETAYYPGILDTWKPPFDWGEQAVIGFIDGVVACASWIQLGKTAGFPTYYGRIFEMEARILRISVSPAFRRRGVNTVLNYKLLQSLFSTGYERVYAECYQYNVSSVKTFLKVGFRPIGRITVLEIPYLRGFVRWHSLGESLDSLPVGPIDRVKVKDGRTPLEDPVPERALPSQ